MLHSDEKLYKTGSNFLKFKQICKNNTVFRILFLWQAVRRDEYRTA